MRKTLEERFWEKVQKTDGCWLWTAATDRHGYGVMGFGSVKNGTRKMVMSHRFSWELHNGPIPEGLFVCHMCDVSLCIRPDHLFLGTQKDNMLDCSKKGRIYKGGPHNPVCGEDNSRSKLTKTDVDCIRLLCCSGVFSYASIGRMFSVTGDQISLIARNKRWKR